ncbi:uncharacterized protein LOC142550565 [Primulina tabacum]|uniref:uncharacterized protein LOC142550565 n=1 Tax=Primulina tabacum TaxID=48773 RepID=UPI003F5A2854
MRDVVGIISVPLLAELWWHTMSTDAREIVRTCEVCQRHGNFSHNPASPMKPIRVACPSDQWRLDIVGPFPIDRVQKKFLLVAVDYFSKWVEGESLAKITEAEVLKFLWKNIVCRFGLHRKLISKNGRQFQGRKIMAWLSGSDCRESRRIGRKSYPTSYGHIELTATRETPYSLVYGSEAMLLVEIGKTSTRIQSYPEGNDEIRAQELDLIEEKRERATVRIEAYRIRVMRAYNQKVRP